MARTLVFSSNADNLVGLDRNGTGPDIFFRNLVTGTTAVVNQHQTGDPNGARARHRIRP